MTIDDVYNYFKSWNQLIKKVGFAPNTPRNWRKMGHIPALAQIRIEQFTESKLKFNVAHLGAHNDVNGE
jgi:hypothetical protein